MTPTAQRLLVVIGALLLVVPPLVWQQTRPPTEVGTPPGSVLSQSQHAAGKAPAVETPEVEAPEVETAATEAPEAEAPATDASAAVDPSTVDPLTEAPSAVDPTAEAPEPPADARPAPPVSISLPALGVLDAPVDDVGLDDNGAVDLPDDVRRVGWYRQAPRPGEAGNAFFTSHVDSRTQGPGVLFDLRRSQPGDPIEVTHADGTTSAWQVVARERIDKGSYPMDRVFRFDGEPGLVIDTCGGSFNAATGSYENIDIVYAVPAA